QAHIVRQPYRRVDFSLPGREPVAAVDGVDQGVRREGAEVGLATPGLRETREQRPSSNFAPRRRDLPGVVIAVGGPGQVCCQVHSSETDILRRQIVRGVRAAIVSGSGPAVGPGVCHGYGNAIATERAVGPNGRADLTAAIPDEAGAHAEVVRHLAFDV